MPNPRRVNPSVFQRIRVALIELAQSSFVPGILCGMVLCLLAQALFAGLVRWDAARNLKFEISEAEAATPARVGCGRSLRESACTARGSAARLTTQASRLTTSSDLLHPRPHVRCVRRLLSTAAVPATNGPATFSQHGYATTCKAHSVGERFDNGHAADLDKCQNRLAAGGLGLGDESTVIAAATGAPALRHLARGNPQLVAGGLTLAVEGDAPGRERRCELPGVRLEFGLGSWGLSLEARHGGRHCVTA